MMTGRLLLGAAAAALVMGAGNARAADVMPIAVAVTPVAVPAPTGREISVTLETYLQNNFYNPGGRQTGIDGFAGIDVKLASGWGFELVAGMGNSLPSFSGSGFLGLRGFRAIGDVEIGMHATIGSAIPLGPSWGYTFGPDFELKTDRLEVVHWTDFVFAGGAGFQFVDADTEVTFTPNDRLKVISNISFETDFAGFAINVDNEMTLKLREHLVLAAEGGVWFGTNPPEFGAWIEGGLRLPFGPITPYFGAGADTDGDFWFEVGAELEHAIGGGPLAIIGDAEFEIGTGWRNIYTTIGLRYQFGVDPP